VKLGFVEGRILSADEVKALAKLPTRDQLISQVMQLALAPAQNFVAALNGITTKLVRTVDAVRQGMESGSIAAAAPAADAPAEAPKEEAAPAAEEAPAEEAPAEETAPAEADEKKTEAEDA
jgi:hypothetical protein